MTVRALTHTHRHTHTQTHTQVFTSQHGPPLAADGHVCACGAYPHGQPHLARSRWHRTASCRLPRASMHGKLILSLPSSHLSLYATLPKTKKNASMKIYSFQILMLNRRLQSKCTLFTHIRLKVTFVTDRRIKKVTFMGTKKDFKRRKLRRFLLHVLSVTPRPPLTSVCASALILLFILSFVSCCVLSGSCGGRWSPALRSYQVQTHSDISTEA